MVPHRAALGPWLGSQMGKPAGQPGEHAQGSTELPGAGPGGAWVRTCPTQGEWQATAGEGHWPPGCQLRTDPFPRLLAAQAAAWDTEKLPSSVGGRAVAPGLLGGSGTDAHPWGCRGP